MSEQSIRKLRKRFIRISFLALFVTMLVIAGLMYIMNLVLTRNTIHNTLDYIVENRGVLKGSSSQEEGDTDRTEERYYTVNRFLEEIFNTGSGNDENSPEFYYATRYFAVLYDEDGAVTDVITNHIASVTETEAEQYGAFARNQTARFGRRGVYYYEVGTYDDGTSIVVYLDSENSVNSSSRLFYICLMLIGFGMILAGIIVRVFSYRAIAPEIENAELQKQFITNASHELKTPLAVIRANTEMQEMLDGETEWTQSTLRQVDRMSGLIQNLVLISRAEEKQEAPELTDCDVSHAVKETAETFRPVAEQDGKTMTVHADEKVTMRADDAQIRQLTSLLVDNAIKYCDESGTITVACMQKGKGCTITVSNTYAEGKDVDYSKFFERFYRADESHNTDKGGYGIGLSIAESLVEQYHGTIEVSWKKGEITFTCALKSIL